MKTINNTIWRFFASLKLALGTLFALAATSIIGTFIQQKQAPAHYLEEYGAAGARLVETLSLNNMYGSWWFIALLLLFALNLVVCSIDRLPGVWRTVVRANPAIDVDQLKRMPCTHAIDTSLAAEVAIEKICRVLQDGGWKTLRRLETPGSRLLFVQKGAWSRLAVYVVHLSILIILAGSIIGSLFGFKAYVFLPEGRSTDKIFMQGTREPRPLGFELHCEKFEKNLYPNGMVREFRADLAIFAPELTDPYRKSIIVNDPLSYQGLTFYQADSYPLEEFYLFMRNHTTGAEQAFRVPPNREFTWPETAATVRIDELVTDADGGVQSAKISFAVAGSVEPTHFWIGNKESVNISPGGQSLSVTFRQLYSTLLLVNKDPGVTVVYLGFALLVIGLFCSFFQSHRRIWINLSELKSGSRILVGGTSNKNQTGFEASFRRLTAALDQLVPPLGK